MLIVVTLEAEKKISTFNKLLTAQNTAFYNQKTYPNPIKKIKRGKLLFTMFLNTPIQVKKLYPSTTTSTKQEATRSAIKKKKQLTSMTLPKYIIKNKKGK